jgi:beta-glucanase (GH16 family)
MSAGAFDPDVLAAEWFDQDAVPEGWFDRDLMNVGGAGAASPTITESLTLADSIARSPQAAARTVTESITFSDSIARAPQAQPRTVTESITFSESVARAPSTRTRSLTETLTLSESLARASLAILRTMAEALSLSETVVGGRISPRTITETLSFVDSAARSLTVARSLTESITFSDSITRVAQLRVRTLAESIAFTDTVAGGRIAPRSITESLTLVDTVARALAVTRSLTESLTLSDSITRAAQTRLRTMTESLALAETIARAPSTRVRTLNEPLALADSIARSLAVARTLTEALTFAETIARAPTARPRTISESLSLSDSILVASNGAVSMAETLHLSEAFSRAPITRPRTITETLHFADAVAAIRVSPRTVSESLTFNETITRAPASRPRTMSDAIHLSDAMSRTLVSTRALIESLTLSEAIVKHWVGSRLLTESLTFTDILTPAASGYVHTFLPDTLLANAVLTGVVSPQISNGLVTEKLGAGLITAFAATGTAAAGTGTGILPADYTTGSEGYNGSLRDKPLTTDQIHVGDTVGPVVTFVSPVEGGRYFGDMTVKALAVDPDIPGSGVFLTAFRTDTTAGAPERIIYYPGPYRYLVDTPLTLTDGTHTIYCRAQDFDNNVGADASVTFTIDNVEYLTSTDPRPIRGYNYHVVFEDTFDGPNIDRDVWDTHIWYDGSPNPLWTDFQTIEDGMAHLRTRREWVGSAGINYPKNTMTTMNSFNFQYGYIEARMKWTDGKGSWPGLWLYSQRHATNPDFPAVNSYCDLHGLNTDRCIAGEIDVFEGQGGPNNLPDFPLTPPQREWYYGTLHRNSAYPTYGVPDQQRPNPNSYNTGGTNLTADFHVYSALWTPDEVVFYLDEQELGRGDAFESLKQPMFILLQEWTGGWAWPLSEDPAETPDLLESVWDYVRVWQL